jgi:hypothetical protein
MKYLILFSSIFFVTSLFGQNAIKKAKTEYVFSPGVIVQGNFHNELNFMIGQKGEFMIMPCFSGIRIGVESNMKYDKDFIIAPKIGYEFSMSVLVFRINALNYFQNRNSNFYIYPEVGISLGGSVNLTYGYNSLKNNDIIGLSKHRIGLSINLNRSLNKGTLYK